MKIFLCIALIFVTLFAKAQKINIKWGEIASSAIPTEAYFVAGHDTTTTYIVTREKYYSGKIYLNKFNIENKLIFSKELTMPIFENNEVNFEKLSLFNDNLILLSSFYSQSNHKNYAFLSTVTPQGTVNDEIIKVDSISNVNQWNPGQFNCTISDDGKKLILYHNDPYRADSVSFAGMYERHGNERFTITVFDKNLKKVWKKKIMLPVSDITIPYNVKEFDIKRYISTKGNMIYLTGGKDADNNGTEYDKRVYVYYIYSFDIKKKQETENILDIGGKYIKDVIMKLDHGNKLVFVGFYANTASYNLAGVFCERLDANTKVSLSQAFRIFNDATLELLKPKQTIPGLNLEAGPAKLDYRIHELVERKDGSYIMTTEQYGAYISDSMALTPHKAYHYVHGNLLTIRIRETGDIDWTSLIPKFQVSENEGGLNSSFIANINKDMLFFIYNDLKENMEVQDIKQMQVVKTVDKVIPVVSVIGAAGNYFAHKELTLDKQIENMTFRPKLCYPIANNKLQMIAVDGNKFMLGTMVFE